MSFMAELTSELSSDTIHLFTDPDDKVTLTLSREDFFRLRTGVLSGSLWWSYRSNRLLDGAQSHANLTPQDCDQMSRDLIELYRSLGREIN